MLDRRSPPQRRQSQTAAAPYSRSSPKAATVSQLTRPAARSYSRLHILLQLTEAAGPLG